MIRLFKPYSAPNIATELDKLLQTGRLTQGPQVAKFEKLLQDELRWPYVVALNSCTSAIHLAIDNIVRMNELIPYKTTVITTPLTCWATHVPVLAQGLNLEFVDIDPKTLNINLDEVEKKLTKDTRILLYVWWGGLPVDQDRLFNIRQKYEQKYGQKLFIIEDCAHAFGSEPIGKLPFNITECWRCYSFQAIKHLNTFDGGALVCPNEAANKFARMTRWFGLDRDNNQDFRSNQNVKNWGYKFHMNDMNATVGICNFNGACKNVTTQNLISERYRHEIKNPNITHIYGEDFSSCWLHTILVDDRAKFTKYMNERFIEVNMVHQRCDKHDCLKNMGEWNLPIMDSLENRYVCIPNHWGLTEEEQNHIIKTVNNYA